MNPAFQFPRSRTNEYFLPGDVIDVDVITCDIGAYLGPDARVRTGFYQNPETNEVVSGFWLSAYRNLTTEMINDLRADSMRWRTAKMQRRTNDVIFTSWNAQMHRRLAAAGMPPPPQLPQQSPQQPPQQLPQVVARRVDSPVSGRPPQRDERLMSPPAEPAWWVGAPASNTPSRQPNVIEDARVQERAGQRNDRPPPPATDPAWWSPGTAPNGSPRSPNEVEDGRTQERTGHRNDRSQQAATDSAWWNREAASSGTLRPVSEGEDNEMEGPVVEYPAETGNQNQIRPGFGYNAGHPVSERQNSYYVAGGEGQRQNTYYAAGGEGRARDSGGEDDRQNGYYVTAGQGERQNAYYPTGGESRPRGSAGNPQWSPEQ